MYRLLRSPTIARMGATCLVKNAASVRAPSKSFLSVAQRPFSIQSDLLDKLDREYQEETLPDRLEVEPEYKEVRQLIENDGWKVVEDDSLTKMVRTTDSFKVTLSFHCQDQIRDTEFDGSEETENNNEDDDEFSDEQIRFSVTATPTNNSGKTLYFSCLSWNAVARIEGVAAIEADAIQKVHTAADVFSNKDYHGPDFSELAEDVAENFLEFLADELGVDGNVATFVAMQADKQEQTQYVQFLKDVQHTLK